jgi:hypothetical protein
VLQALQNLLAGIYDVPLTHDVAEFLVTDRSELPEELRTNEADEQVLVAEDRGTLWVTLYLEPTVLQRLASANPFEALHSGNIADYWTALEGVSHFVYLVWNASYDRPVTPLELELQGEVDKYVGSLWLLQAQNPKRFPAELHPLLFERARVDAALAGDRVGLYRRANSYAARFCRRLASALRPAGSTARAAAIAELRRFYRLSRDRKFQYIERTALRTQ